jgi:hypothetical protein
MAGIRRLEHPAPVRKAADAIRDALRATSGLRDHRDRGVFSGNTSELYV